MALTPRPLAPLSWELLQGPTPIRGGGGGGREALSSVEVSAEQARRGAGGDLSDQPAAPRLLTAPSEKKKKERDRIIQIFRKSEIVVGGNAGLDTPSLPRACLNVGSLTIAHPAERKEDSFHPPQPRQTELFTKFPQTELRRKPRQVGLKFH